MGEGARPEPRWLYLLCMTKEGIRNNLKASREWNSNARSKNWKQAFDLYSVAKGVRLSMKCNKCFSMVKEWLEEA